MRVKRPGGSRVDIRMPYATFRTPKSAADATAAGIAASPPAEITPTKANCEPPVNMTRLRMQVCQTSSPAATDSAPNETPYALVASATLTPWRHAPRAASVSPPSGGTSTGSMLAILQQPFRLVK